MPPRHHRAGPPVVVRPRGCRRRAPRGAAPGAALAAAAGKAAGSVPALGRLLRPAAIDPDHVAADDHLGGEGVLLALARHLAHHRDVVALGEVEAGELLRWAGIHRAGPALHGGHLEPHAILVARDAG